MTWQKCNTIRICRVPGDTGYGLCRQSMRQIVLIPPDGNCWSPGFLSPWSISHALGLMLFGLRNPFKAREQLNWEICDFHFLLHSHCFTSWQLPGLWLSPNISPLPPTLYLRMSKNYWTTWKDGECPTWCGGGHNVEEKNPWQNKIGGAHTIIQRGP